MQKLKEIILNSIPDSIYLSYFYKKRLGKRLNLRHPKTFNEKIQWLKIHDRNPEYVKMVDKYEAKKYVASVIGDEYIIPTLGMWDKFDDIDFDSLPNQFVLKCTHDSGGLVIVKDKSQMDKNSAREKIERSLKRNYYYCGREWPYKNVKPRIIAEKYMASNGESLCDYKVHNFDNVPKVILVCRDRFEEGGLKEDFYSTQWEHLDLKRPNVPNFAEVTAKPPELDEMLKLSKQLSKGIPFLRTDFYSIDGKLFFGELTFYPASGFSAFEPEKFDLLLGSWITLPSKDQSHNRR